MYPKMFEDIHYETKRFFKILVKFLTFYIIYHLVHYFCIYTIIEFKKKYTDLEKIINVNNLAIEKSKKIRNSLNNESMEVLFKYSNVKILDVLHNALNKILSLTNKNKILSEKYFINKAENVNISYKSKTPFSFFNIRNSQFQLDKPFMQAQLLVDGGTVRAIAEVNSATINDVCETKINSVAYDINKRITGLEYTIFSHSL